MYIHVKELYSVWICVAWKLLYLFIYIHTGDCDNFFILNSEKRLDIGTHVYDVFY